MGDLDLAKVRFTPEAHGVLDAGDAYASNISMDDKGRTILWLWGRTNTPEGKGWAGVIAMPRVISIGPDGYLRQIPAQEFQSLRGSQTAFPATSLETPFITENISDAAEIEAEFTGDGTVGLELRRGADGRPAVTVAVQGGYLTVGNARAFVGNSSRYKFHIFLDKRCIEVYINDGVAALYHWLDAGPKELGIAAFGLPRRNRSLGSGLPGGVPASTDKSTLPPPRMESLKIWPMKPATFSLQYFHD